MNITTNKKPKLNIQRIKQATRVYNTYYEFIQGKDGVKITKYKCNRFNNTVWYCE